MLKLKDLIENFDLAKTALQNWAYDEDTVDACFQYFRISSNAIYPFRQAGRLCFLRLAPVGEKLLTNLQGEIEFLLYLQAQSYSALTPIPANNGEYLLTLDTPWGAYYASAFYGVAGEPVENSDFSEKVCLEYGKALGSLHKLSSTYVPKVKKQTHDDSLNGIRERLTALGCEKPILDGLDALRRELAALPKDSLHYGLVHYDFECDNVFYNEETNCCNVIDFEDGMYHFYAMDIVRALDSIDEEAPEDAAQEAKAAFLAGYRTAFPFDEAAEATLPLMRKFADYYGYASLLYCLSESVEEEPDWMVDLKQILTGKAEEMAKKLKNC